MLPHSIFRRLLATLHIESVRIAPNADTRRADVRPSTTVLQVPMEQELALLFGWSLYRWQSQLGFEKSVADEIS